jgi:hypothetical protein
MIKMERNVPMAKAITSATPNQPSTSDQIHFAIMDIKKGEISTILRENLGADDPAARDLPQVSVPAGGGTMFSVPSIDGAQDLREIVGIIVATKHTRAYWKDSFDETGGGTPPDCISEDGECGLGDPGGDCASCPYSVFGSAKNERGKACSEKRLIFMTTPEEILPIVIKAPPTSLKNAKSYLMGLTSRGKKLYEVFTGLSLEKDKSKDGITYSKIMFHKVGDVTDKELITAYAESIKPYLTRAIKDIAATREPLGSMPDSE